MGFRGALFNDARILARTAAQRAMPGARRLPYYQNANLPASKASLAAVSVDTATITTALRVVYDKPALVHELMIGLE